MAIKNTQVCAVNGWLAWCVNYIRECCLVFLVKKSKKEQQLCEEMFWASWAVPGILVEGEGLGDGSIGVFLGITQDTHARYALRWQRWNRLCCSGACVRTSLQTFLRAGIVHDSR